MMLGSIQHIIIIQSLSKGESQSGLDLYKDVIVRHIDYRKSPITHNYFDAPSKDELFKVLAHINDVAKYIPGGLVIHLEMHGSLGLEGLICGNGELVVWSEVIEFLRAINITLHNSLYITMATCFGRYLYKGVDPYEKSPYSGFISASKAVKLDEVIENFTELFTRLIESGNLLDAFLETEKINPSNFYYKDSKTTFEDSIIATRIKIDTDPEFKKSLIDQFVKLGIPHSSQDVDQVVESAFQYQIQKQKEAFNF